MSQQNILGVKVDLTTFDKALATVSKFISEPRFHLVTTVNAEFILTAQDDSEFKEILNSADLSLPEYGPIFALKLSRLVGRTHRSAPTPVGSIVGVDPCVDPSRIAGSDFVPVLIQLAAEKGWSVGLLGGEEYQNQNVCDLVKAAWLATYPNLKVTYCSREPSDAVFATPIDILLVAWGHPKQEKWLWHNRQQLNNVRVGIGVGGTFDFIVGKQKRAPLFIRRLGLEGLWRLVREPKRWKRVLRAYVVFPLRVFLSSLRS